MRANSNGYTTYENSSHRYYVRVFAKAKGGNRIWWVNVEGQKSPYFQVSSGSYFKQEAGHSEGWGVYKKSLAIDVSFAHTHWWGSPKEACEANLKAQMNKGMKKSDVLKKEWNVTAHAILWFNAEADTKSHNKKNEHTISSSDSGAKSVSYPVNVVCRKGI